MNVLTTKLYLKEIVSIVFFFIISITSIQAQYEQEVKYIKGLYDYEGNIYFRKTTDPINTSHVEFYTNLILPPDHLRYYVIVTLNNDLQYAHELTKEAFNKLYENRYEYRLKLTQVEYDKITKLHRAKVYLKKVEIDGNISYKLNMLRE